jgi:hypothetical protein
MAWGTPGVTIRRKNTFQSPAVSWGASQQRVPFNPLTNIGILRALRIRVPYTVGTNSAGASALTAQVVANMPQLNMWNRIQVQMAGMTACYDITGRDLGYLMYVGSGFNMSDRPNNWAQLGYYDVAANTPTFYSFPTSIAPTSMSGKKVIPLIEYNHAGPLFTVSSDLHLPLTEFITIPGTAGIDANGNIAQVMGDTELEVGLMVMQSAAQSVSINAVLAATQGADFNSVFLPGTTGYDLLTASLTVNLEHDYYDLPGNAADMPNILQTGMAVTRVARDMPVTSGTADYYYLRGGLLLRSIYVFYNDTTNYGTTVDISADATQTPDKITVILQDGQSTQYINETAADNIWRCWQRYDQPPPGVLIHDLLAEGFGSLTQCISTPQTTALRTSFRGLPSAITRMHVIEERLVPVQVTTNQ